MFSEINHCNVEHQNFVNFLEFVAKKVLEQEYKIAIESFVFNGEIIGLHEAKILTQIINKTKLSSSLSISLDFDCHVSQDAFQHIIIMMMSQCNYNNMNIISSSKRQKQKYQINICGRGINCSHVKCLNQQLLSLLFGSLSLSRTNINNDGTIALANALCHNTTITSLNLSCNEIGPSGAQALAKMLLLNSTLESLYLYCNNTIGDDGVVPLANSLKVNSSLQFLDIMDVGCGNQSLLALAEAITINHGLKFLDFSYNSITHENIIQQFGNAVKQNSTLNELIMTKTMSDGGNDKLIVAFVNALDGKHNKLVLDLSQNNNVYSELLDNDDAYFELLLQCKAQQLSLDLRQNKFQPTHFEAIARAIQQETFQVKSLNLEDNEANDDCIMHLFNALVSTRGGSLVELSLRHVQGITSIGGQYIIDKIPFTNLQNIDLKKIPIGNNGVQQIASYLNDTALTTLGLNNVDMEDSGLIALAEALKKNFKN